MIQMIVILQFSYKAINCSSNTDILFARVKMAQSDSMKCLFQSCNNWYHETPTLLIVVNPWSSRRFDETCGWDLRADLLLPAKSNGCNNHTSVLKCGQHIRYGKWSCNAKRWYQLSRASANLSWNVTIIMHMLLIQEFSVNHHFWPGLSLDFSDAPKLVLY